MKKLLALLFCIVMIVSMVGCASDEAETTEAPTTEAPTTEAPTTEPPVAQGDEMSLTEIMDTLYNGYTEELPMLATTELTDAETFEWITYASYVEGYEAVCSEPMMSSIAHSVVLVRVPEGTDVESVRAEIEQNHDPRKWICVEAEKSAVIAHNNTILLVMSTTALADVVIANFDALWA